MWTYIVRRLLIMIPTLFGVTVVSFLIMQLAPGDPLLAKAGSAAVSGQTSQTRDAYLTQKRDLKLDKPLLLNFNYFRDYDESVRIAIYYAARSDEEIAAGLPKMAAESDDPKIAARKQFLERIKVPEFQERLKDPKRHIDLAQAIQAYVQVFCEDTGMHGVPPAVAILQSPDADLREKIGAIRSLNFMVTEPFVYTYSRDPTDAETPAILSTWQTWWNRAEAKFPKISDKRRDELSEEFATLVAEPSRGKVVEGIRRFRRNDARFFIEKLLGDSTLREKAVAAMGLRQAVGKPLSSEVPLDAKEKLVARVSENWLAWYDAHQAEFHPSDLRKTWYIFSDTQYAHMVVRLATFNFGRSVVKTREPVSDMIWRAVLVTAPLMFFAELIIYLVAVPLGILCAVKRNGWVDRSVSFVLFLLYSIPPFVAGMLFLLFFCYGEYLSWFPMLGLHSQGADKMGWIAYTLDYLHHIVLPVACLSLFSLAGMAMYARSSLLDVIEQDYIRTARAKGLPERVVILKHGFRNALIPIITLFASFLPAMLGGSVLIEYLFNVPGMGVLSLNSILLKDTPTLMALVYIDAIVVMLSILLSDILYVLVDPRISFEGQGQSA